MAHATCKQRVWVRRRTPSKTPRTATCYGRTQQIKHYLTIKYEDCAVVRAVVPALRQHELSDHIGVKRQRAHELRRYTHTQCGTFVDIKLCK